MNDRIIAWVELVRPANLALGAIGVWIGGIAQGHGSDALMATIMVGVFGMAGANALNDAFDERIDRGAHPARPIATGRITAHHARIGAALLFGAALMFAAGVNVIVLLAAAALVVIMVAYEAWLKQQTLLGNAAVSISVAGLLLLGAWTAAPGLLNAGAAPFSIRQTNLLVWVIVAIAFLSTMAREIYKDLQDAAYDAGTRSTGLVARPVLARALAGILIVETVFVALGEAVAHPRAYGNVLWYVVELTLLAAALGFLVAAPFRPAPGLSARFVKIGMAFGLAWGAVLAIL